MFLFGKQNIYIDICDTEMKYLQAGWNLDRTRIEVIKHGTINFDSSFVEEGMIKDNEDTVKVFKNFFRAEELYAKNVYLNINDSSVMLRTVKVPLMAPKDLDSYMELEVGNFLPTVMENRVYHFKVLGNVMDGEKMMIEVLLISITQEVMNNYESLFKKVGLQLKVIDVYANSIARLFQNPELGDVIVIDTRGNAVEFVIVKSGKLFMHTKETLNCKHFAQDYDLFIKSLGILIEYIKRYTAFFSVRHSGKVIDGIYLLGDITTVPGIDDLMSMQLKIPVKKGITEIYNINFAEKVRFDSIKQFNLYSGNLGLLMRGV